VHAQPNPCLQRVPGILGEGKGRPAKRGALVEGVDACPLLMYRTLLYSSVPRVH